MRSLFYFTQLLILSTAPAMANDDLLNASLPEVEGEEIQVIEAAPREKLVGDVHLEIESSFHTVIPKEEFENKITDVAQIISQATSVQVRREGGLGSFSSLSLRGSSGARLPIYVDGVLLNESSTGNVNLNSIALNQIDLIEVYRGVVPMAFSQASIAGAINIRTRRINKVQAQISTGIGSFATQKLDGSYASSFGKWDYLLSAAHLASKNNYKYVFNNGTQFNDKDDYVSERKNNDYLRNNVFIKLKRRFVQRGDLTFSIDSSKEDKLLPAWNNVGLSDTQNYAELNSSIINTTANWVDNRGFGINKKLSLGWRSQKILYDDRDSIIGLSKQYVRFITERKYINLFGEKFWKNNLISGTVEVAHDTFKPENLIGSSEYASSYRWSSNSGLQIQSMFLSDRLIVSPGIRYYYEFSHRNKSIELDAADVERGSLSLQLGSSYELTRSVKFKSNIARYYRAPTFNELFGNQGISKGNPELLTENGLNIDFGMEWRKTWPKQVIKSLLFSLSYYQVKIRDAIVWIYSAQGIGQPDNTESQIKGAEVEVRLETQKYVNFQSSLNLQDARINDKNPFFDNKRLPGHAYLVSQNKFQLTPNPQWQWSLEYNASLGKYYDKANSLPIKDQYRLNTTLTWQPSPWRVDLALNNLLDQKQEDYYLKPIPGRALYLTVRYQL